MQAVPDDKANGYAFLLGILGLCLCVGLVLFWVFFFGQPPGSALVQREDVFCTGVLLVATISAVVSWLRWQQIDQRRQAAANGTHGGAALAAIQPFPDEVALLLPAVIVHKRSRLREIVWSLGFYIGVYALFTFIDDFPLRSWGWAAFFTDIRSMWPGGVGYLVGLSVASLLRSPYTQLEVRTFGLTLSTPTKTKLVRWREARLFAVRGPRTSFSKAVTYEFASASEVITWKPLRRLHWWSIERPIVPFEEYQRQMEGLLSLIAARTHLPLYDVRQPPAE
jgi:hypothetical protein